MIFRESCGAAFKNSTVLPCVDISFQDSQLKSKRPFNTVKIPVKQPHDHATTISCSIAQHCTVWLINLYIYVDASAKNSMCCIRVDVLDGGNYGLYFISLYG